MGKLESKIQAEVRATLVNLGWRVIKYGIEGWPDLIAFRKPGKTIFIETKQPGKKPDPLQSFIHRIIKLMGFDVIVATNKEELINGLIEIGQGVSKERDLRNRNK